MNKQSVRRFFGLVLLLLPVAFVAWQVLGSVIAAPVVWLAGLILQWWIPELVSSVTLDNTTMVIASALGELDGQFLPAAEAGNQLAFQVDTRGLTYSIPFYAALHFATPMESPVERFARGLLILWLLVIVGLVSVAIKTLMLGLGSTFFTLGTVPSPDVIALAFQFNSLMVPPIAPLLIWAYEARDLGLFPNLLETKTPADTDGPKSPET
ncbi:MAG: hypothetical protein ACJA09_000939 [Alcanivorax sp.]